MSAPVPTPTVRAALKLALQEFPQATEEGMLGPSRRYVFSMARAYAMAILRAKGWPLVRIAEAFGRSDHTTARCAIQRAHRLFPDTDFGKLAKRATEFSEKARIVETPTAPPVRVSKTPGQRNAWQLHSGMNIRSPAVAAYSSAAGCLQ